jgi:NADH-quinone oxidoreductase subunit L
MIPSGGIPLFAAVSGLAAVGGVLVALLASLVAIAQYDIRRALVWSAAAQLGWVAAAAGIGAYPAAVFHLVMLAFFLAPLFLGAGLVVRGMERGALEAGDKDGAADMRAMGGLARRMPLAFAAFAAGGFSLAGFPILTAGFWSRLRILSAALYASPVVFAALALAALLAAFSAARQIMLVFAGQPRSEAARAARAPSRRMLAPVLALAVLAVGAGWAGIPHEFPLLGRIVPDVTGGLPTEQGWALSPEEITRLMETRSPICCTPVTPVTPPFNYWPLVLSAAVALGGLFLGWLAYRHFHPGEEDPLELAFGRLHGFIRSGFRLGDLCDALFVSPVRRFLGSLAAWRKNRRM